MHSYTHIVIEGSVEILFLGSDVTLFLQKRQIFQWASELDLEASFRLDELNPARIKIRFLLGAG